VTDIEMVDDLGVQTGPETIEIARLLPGPIERVWSYLTESDLRRRWLAAGDMELKAGAPFELTWRNDELTDPPGTRPEGFGVEHRATMTMVEIDPPHRLTFIWPDTGEVSFALAERGKEVLFTITHRRAPNRRTMVGVSAGWHMHIDVLAGMLSGRPVTHFWDRMAPLRQVYEARLSD
jgi:uncharacterized protein YndB with AHSA1/START domain